MNAKSLVLACGIFAGSLIQPATAGGPLGGSTEVTQLMNNVQLVNSYAKQVESVLTQVKQYQAILMSLQRMDPAKLAAMGLNAVGVHAGADVIRSIEQITELNARMSRLSKSTRLIAREGEIAIDTISLMRERGIDISPEDYAEIFRQLAEDRDNIYSARYDELNLAIEDSQSDIERMNAIAETAPEIATNVEGFGALVQSNSVMVGQLGGIRQSLARNGAVQSEMAQSLAEQEARAAASAMMVNQWRSHWSTAPKSDPGE